MQATITDESGEKIALELKLAADGRYRWFESATGADTEVSGRTQEEAQQAAADAWRRWEISFS